ncbi:MAG: ABC transporter ATP-binding protein [Bifidobacteriaceae bacterium]|jgi:energy-coupling factor transport system ATP-binding protein|nr:ABC transporter ATP-binding protein [Bifidobacteriaceae bacterium]
MIRLDGVSWTYPHAASPSLRAIDLRIRPGELVVLCGASGCGKSTLLRVMNGLIPHFHPEGTLTGSVKVGGLDTAGVELDQLGLVTGTVLQHPRRQFFTDTAPEELAFAMENFGFPPAEIRARVADLAAALAPAVPPNARLRHLSGGLQQQVAIASATAHRPQVLLLDEPSSNLSADAVRRLAATVSGLRSDGLTVVIAEHRLRYLRDLADRVVVLDDGRIGVEWSAAEFRDVPDSALEGLGLRGEVRPAALPPIAATGPSVAAPNPDGAASAGLELAGVRCRIGGRLVLDLDRALFPAGQVTCVRGANGVGKTTLARVVAGLQRSSGQVRFDGRAWSRRGRQRLSAIVMQDVQRQLFTDTVQAEIELAAARAPGGPSAERVLAALDLADLAGRHPLSLSGGQQQRLVVAAARVSGRRIVIFDEPSSGVDRRHLRSISDQIRQVAAGPATVLLISHDEDLIALAGDCQLWLRPVCGL